MLIEHLREELAARSLKNPKYSLRAFSRALDIDSSTLSALLHNKRRLSVRMAMKLMDALDVHDPGRRQRLLMESFDDRENQRGENRYRELTIAQFTEIFPWEHFGILALLEISLPRPDLKSIAAALNLTTTCALAALNRLEALGLVSHRFGRWHLTQKNLATPSGIPSEAIRLGNRQNIEKALHSLEKDSIYRRDITGITMAIDARKLPEAKKRIQEFRRSLAEFLEQDNKSAVYRLNIQLFPLSGDDLDEG